MPKLNALTDDELIHLLKKDDRAAFTEIYHRYAESLAGFAASRLSSLDDARDILHDLFVNIWENRQSLNINSNLKAWLFSAIRHKIIDKIRRDTTRDEYKNILESSTEPSANNIEQQSEVKDLQKIIDRSLEELPAKTKEIYLLSRKQHQSITEIANFLGLSEQTVKNQLSIALKHLRQAISGASLLAVLVDMIKK